MSGDPEVLVMATVIITRAMRLHPDGTSDVVDHIAATTADGDELGLAEALGMMRLAEDTLIRARTDPDPHDDPEDLDD